MTLWRALILAFCSQMGSWTSDKMGPRLALSVFVAAQGVVGFIMSGAYGQLQQPQYIGAFVVVYGSKSTKASEHQSVYANIQTSL